MFRIVQIGEGLDNSLRSPGHPLPLLLVRLRALLPATPPADRLCARACIVQPVVCVLLTLSYPIPLWRSPTTYQVRC
jgi:hypothetical protein